MITIEHHLVNTTYSAEDVEIGDKSMANDPLLIKTASSCGIHVLWTHSKLGSRASNYGTFIAYNNETLKDNSIASIANTWNTLNVFANMILLVFLVNLHDAINLQVQE